MRRIELTEAEAHEVIDALNRNLDATQNETDSAERRICVRAILQKVDNARRCIPDDCPS